jgi:hypothetical protein
MADGKKVFDLASLREGSYTLRAYLERGAARSFELLKEHPHKFRVDLTPPVFQVEVKNPQAFIEVQPPFRTTFDEWIDLQLDCPAADIAEARWQIVFGEQTLPYRPIEDVTRWQIDLPFGKSTYRVYAKDAAHNQTAATELTFRRLKLSCESFELAAPEAGGAPVTGNLARVKGVLLVEGEESPALRYFAISGKDETPIEPEAAGSSLDWEDYPRHGGVPFAAHLRLPYETNTIEIRYAWKENRPQPFARPMRIHDVRVQAPRIELAPVPERTASTRILLQGRIDPYFEGLEVLLQNVGQGTFWLTLAREPGGTASFAQHADLIPNQPNIIRIECRYRDKQLASPPVPVSVFCDRTPPEVTARCEIQGEGLTVRLYPSEVLKELRIQELGGMGELGDWRILEPEGLSSLYRHLVMPVPSRPVGFRVEMTDLAGNREFRDVYCQGESLAPSVASVASTENSSTRSGSAAEPRPAIESSSPRSSPGTENATKPAPPEYRSIDIQSAFLKDMGLDFVPFGHQRLEMARTELPEKVWYRFLAEKGHAPAKTGLADYPMTLADTAPELLREFVGWFQERARDGFDYEIPSREHWIAAFTGMSDTEAARRALVEWFQKSFQEPNERYGVNRPSAIGSRRVNATPTGLLDMESNVQEIVLEGEKFAVIGGSNRDTGAWQIQEHCLQARAYGTEERDLRGRVTGFRLCRRPARAR